MGQILASFTRRLVLTEAKTQSLSASHAGKSPGKTSPSIPLFLLFSFILFTMSHINMVVAPDPEIIRFCQISFRPGPLFFYAKTS